jgi:2-octaprenylphenol hydroxylase
VPHIKSDIVIVGAGLIGSALALWLAKHSDHSITLIERNQAMSVPSQSNQRVVALGALATDFLDDIDILTSLDSDHCYPYRKMSVWDDNSDGELCFDAAGTGHEYLGHMIDSQMCAYQLQQAVSASRVDCHFDAHVSQLDLNRLEARVKTDSGDISAKVLLAADGAKSWVRQQAKIFANHQSYGQYGVVAKIETEKSHQDCAWQCFLSTGPIAILPLSQNHSSLVWSADEVLAKQLLAMSDEEFGVTLSSSLEGRLGSVKLLNARQAFPLASLKAERYFTRNLALVGDAAHSIHPLAGQGANLGFKDAMVLGELLAKTKPSELGSPRVLSAYQAKRQPDNVQTDALMSTLHQAYKIDIPILMLVRGLGMNFVNGSDSIRGILARHAMGL